MSETNGLQSADAAGHAMTEQHQRPPRGSLGFRFWALRIPCRQRGEGSHRAQGLWKPVARQFRRHFRAMTQADKRVEATRHFYLRIGDAQQA